MYQAVDRIKTTVRIWVRIKVILFEILYMTIAPVIFLDSKSPISNILDDDKLMRNIFCRRIFGVTTLDIVRANTFVAELKVSHEVARLLVCFAKNKDTD